MPTINRAEETLYRWLARHYPRITQHHDPAQLIELRREFSQRDRRYAVDMSAMRADFLHHLGERHDYDGARVSERGFDVFYRARQQVEMYQDVIPCLQRLRARYRLGSISNGNASVEQVGLGHLIEPAVSAAEVQAAKPDPQIYRYFARRCGAEPEQIVYVGDHPAYDVQGSIEAGFHAVWINREQMSWPEELPQPLHQVTDLHQLEELLNA